MISVNWEKKELFHIPHFKLNKFLGILLFLFFGFLNGNTNSNIADYQMYENWYNYTGQTGIFQFEKGYSFFAMWCYEHGIQYSEFRLIFSLLTMVIMCYAVCRFTDNVLLVALLYGFSIFYVDAFQIRSQMMIAIVLLGLSFLKNFSKYHITISIILILLSTLVHTSGAFFLVIVFIRILLEKRIKFLNVYAIAISIFGIIVFAFFGRPLLNLLAKTASLIFSRSSLASKIMSMYSTGISIELLIEISAVAVCCLFLSSYMCFPSNKVISGVNAKTNYILYSVALFSVVTLPFLMFSADYSRLQRGAVLFFFIQISSYLCLKKSIKLKIIFLVISIIMASLSYYVFLKVYGTKAFTSVPLFWDFRN